MNKKDFQILYDFNRWANARVLDAAAKLNAEQYTRDLSNSFRSATARARSSRPHAAPRSCT